MYIILTIYVIFGSQCLSKNVRSVVILFCTYAPLLLFYKRCIMLFSRCILYCCVFVNIIFGSISIDSVYPRFIVFTVLHYQNQQIFVPKRKANFMSSNTTMFVLRSDEKSL